MSEMGSAGSLPPLLALLMANVEDFLAGMITATESAAYAAGAIDASMASIDASVAGVGTATVAAAAETSAGAGGFTGAISQFFSNAGDQAASLGPKVALAAGVFTVASVVMAGNFQQSMLRIQTQANASEAEVKKMSDEIMKLAPQVGDSPKKLADALYPIESVGLRGAAALDALRLAAEGAKVGGSDLETTASTLASVLASNVLGPNGNATQGMSLLNAIVGLGKMRMDDLNAAMSSGILDTANTFGISLQSVGASLDVMTSNGVPAAQAATRLRQAIALMAAPSKQAAGILKDLGLTTDETKQAIGGMGKLLESAGVTTTQLADDLKKPDGLYVAMEDLKAHFEKAGMSADLQSATITRAFGGGRLGQAIQSMFGHVDELKGKFDAIGSTAGNFGADWEAQSQTFNQQWDQMIAKVDVLAVTFGNFLIPKIEAVVKWFEKHKLAAEILAGVIGGVLVAALIAFGVAVIAATWEILLVMAAVAALVAGVIYAYQHWSWFRTVIHDVATAFMWVKDRIMDAWNYLKAVDWGAIWKGIVDFVEGVPGMLDNAWNWIINGIQKIPYYAGWLAGYIEGWMLQLPSRLTTLAWNAMKAFISWAVDAYPNVITAITRMWDWVSGWLSNLPGNILSWLWDADQWLWNVGGDMLRGLLNGAVDALKGAGNFFSSIGSGIVDGFKSAFGINSPSLLMMHEVGMPIGEGFILGVKNSMPKNLAPFIPNLGSHSGNISLGTTLAGGPGGPLGVGGGGGGTTVVIQQGAVQINGLVVDPVATGRAVNGALEKFVQSGGTPGSWASGNN